MTGRVVRLRRFTRGSYPPLPSLLVLAAGHPELAGKITRAARPGERTYVSSLGVTGAAALAMAVPVLSAALLAAGSQAPAGWTLAALAR